MNDEIVRIVWILHDTRSVDEIASRSTVMDHIKVLEARALDLQVFNEMLVLNGISAPPKLLEVKRTISQRRQRRQEKKTIRRSALTHPKHIVP